jgi:hypothetical protein
MNVSSFKTLITIAALFLLVGCVPPPAGNGGAQQNASSENPPPIADVAPTPEATAEAQPAETAPQLRAVDHVSLRKGFTPVDQISAWRNEAEENENKAPRETWDGVQMKDLATLFPILMHSPDKKIRKIIRRIAMSAVYTPEGMQDMDYIRWRSDVLAKQEEYTAAARILNIARIGRDQTRDLETRVAYQLASNQTDAACLEAMANGRGQSAPFWQGMEVLCAQVLGDKTAAENLRLALPDGDIKTAAEKMATNPAPLRAALVDVALQSPKDVMPPKLEDNAELLRRLKRLVSEIKEDENLDGMIAANRGQLLLLSLGALSAEKRSDDTDSITKEAMAMAGY